MKTIFLVALLATASISLAWKAHQGAVQQWTTITIKNSSNVELFNILFHYNKSPTDTHWMFPFFHRAPTCSNLAPGDSATAAVALDTATLVDYYEYAYTDGNTTK